MPEILLTVRTHIVESDATTTVTIDDEEWEEMDYMERQNSLFYMLTESGIFEWDWEVVE